MCKKKTPAGYTLAGCFDTETSQFPDPGRERAYTYSWQWNDLRDVDLLTYTSGRDDRLHISTDPARFIEWIRELVDWGLMVDRVPVVAAYNLGFDLQSLYAPLSALWPDMRTTAQSGRTLYTLELWAGDRPVLRFWDCYHLNKSGLAVMGLLAGLPKLTGSWDYDRVRVPLATPLSAEECAYALRDVQVIPAYLRSLLDTHEWLGQDEFGHTVQTQTSLVRRYGREVIGSLYASERQTLWEAYCMRCRAEAPKSFASYAARKACFRGGLCFTAAKLASVPVENVASLDVTSMHHTFMARFIPVQFRPATTRQLEIAAREILSTPRALVLGRYYQPFTVAFHARFHVTGLRQRKGSCFEAWDIATLAASRFGAKVETFDPKLGRDEAEEAALDSIMQSGFKDSCHGGHFTFAKLVEAAECDLWLSEVELWILSRVYQWDSLEAVSGEVSTNWRKAPDYIGLMSRTLYAQKAETKHLIRTYREGEPYCEKVGEHVPRGIAEAARAGTLTGGNRAGNHGALDAYYLYLKQMFNSIYGMVAQDELKPRFKVEGGVVEVDPATIPTGEAWERLKPRAPRVLYTQGLRIVAGSRLHLILGMELLWEALGERCDVLGGDTDSLKIRLDPDVTDDELMDALKPLHDAADWCLDRGYARSRMNYPGAYIEMPGVGHFDLEDCGQNADGSTAHRWAWHMELWNKARVSIDGAGHASVTCAGLSRPKGTYTMTDWYEDAAKARGAEWALTHGLGYNVLVRNSLCHMLGRTAPKPTDVFDEDVADYMGTIEHVTRPEAVCLYNVDKMIGDPATGETVENLHWLETRYGRRPLTSFRILAADDWKEKEK